MLGTNGVIHAIDTVLIPETARDITEALDESHMTTFKELFEIAGLDKDDEMNNVTIFAPSERALATLPSSVLDDLKADPAKLKEFLLFHVAKPKTCQCDFEDNKVLKTALDNNNAKLRINTYDDNILRPLIAGKKFLYRGWSFCSKCFILLQAWIRMLRFPNMARSLSSALG